jgi:DNA-binding MltR family transcriptional regulator
MAASRNRGVKKPKLRDYSHMVLTPDERTTISAIANSPDQNPIVTAILGYVLVEHELDLLLRPRFKRRDDETWQALQDERGPLRSFYAKIAVGHAFGIYDDKLRNDLDVIRTVRNAFAHSKKLLHFDDPLIVPELLSARLLAAKFKKSLQSHLTKPLASACFVIICLRVQTALLRKQFRASQARAYRQAQKRQARSPLVNALLGGPYAGLGGPYSGVLHLADPKSAAQSSRVGPNPSTPKGLAEALRPFLEDSEK